MNFSVNLPILSEIDYSNVFNEENFNNIQEAFQNVSVPTSDENDLAAEEIGVDDIIGFVKDQYDALTTSQEEFNEQELQAHETYAQIASDTMSDESQGEIGGYKRIDTIENNENGFAACIYENENTNEIVISYRCTNNEGGQESDMQLAQDKIPDQYEDALRVYDEMKKKYPDKDIQIVGYSLGASLAELVASEREDAKAVTFEGYGTKTIVENNPQFKDNGNCINYTSQDSLVSGSSQHPGDTRTIKHDGDGATDLYGQVANRHYIDNFFNLQEAEFVNEDVEDVKRGLKQKGKDEIIEKFPGALELAKSYFFG